MIRNTYCEILNDDDNDDLNELTNYITKYLIEFGFNCKLRGFDYTRDAILMRINIKSVNFTAKKCYIQIAKKYGVTSIGVERAVRYAIENSWVNECVDHTKYMFCPGNAEFIAETAEKILMNFRKKNFETYFE